MRCTNWRLTLCVSLPPLPLALELPPSKSKGFTPLRSPIPHSSSPPLTCCHLLTVGQVPCQIEELHVTETMSSHSCSTPQVQCLTEATKRAFLNEANLSSKETRTNDLADRYDVRTPPPPLDA
jgi:hypothetical protein